MAKPFDVLITKTWQAEYPNHITEVKHFEVAADDRAEAIRNAKQELADAHIWHTHFIISVTERDDELN